MKIHTSQFSGHLCCEHCYEEINSTEWPLNGDATPFYYETSPSEYSIKLVCKSCGESTYVVWDAYPGPIEPLDTPDENGITSTGAVANNKLYPAVKAMVQQAMDAGMNDYDELIQQAERAYGTTFTSLEELRSLFRSAWIELHQ